jgi:hypothetical protein
MRTWTFPERHPSIPGPWADEPDKAQWIDHTTDLDCLAVRNWRGAWCGYVGVPPGHPLHGIGYMEAEEQAEWFDVHGGLTYSDFCQEGAEDGPGICHVLAPGRPANVWWFGFDCAHYTDATPHDAADEKLLGLAHMREGVYRTLDYVRGEVANLARQLAEVES